MVTFAIGDVQGCAITLRRLLSRLRRDAGFDPARDSLWLTGDLVNRGTHSLDVLRWAHDSAEGRGSEPLGDRLRVVLGNHDLHLLALAAGVEKPAKKDTVQDILDAKDRKELIGWLRRQPLLHAEPVDGRPHVLVHAGLPPGWSVAKATGLAAELHAELAGPDWKAAAGAVKRSKPDRWDEAFTGGKRLAAIAAALTRLRVVDGRGRMQLDYKGPPSLAPAGVVPWFAVPGRKSTDHVVVCGHWAALGLHLSEDVVACDSACVWGGPLTAVKLAAQAAGRVVVQEQNAEEK